MGLKPSRQVHRRKPRLEFPSFVYRLYTIFLLWSENRRGEAGLMKEEKHRMVGRVESGDLDFGLGLSYSLQPWCSPLSSPNQRWPPPPPLLLSPPPPLNTHTPGRRRWAHMTLEPCPLSRTGFRGWRMSSYLCSLLGALCPRSPPETHPDSSGMDTSTRL